jgi:hypothetical protein
MTGDRIDLQQSHKQGSLSRGDEALEAAHEGLIRDAGTRLIYRDAQCLPRRADTTKTIINDCARKVL